MIDDIFFDKKYIQPIRLSTFQYVKSSQNQYQDVIYRCS